MTERATLHDEEGAVSWSYTDVNSSYPVGERCALWDQDGLSSHSISRCPIDTYGAPLCYLLMYSNPYAGERDEAIIQDQTSSQTPPYPFLPLCR